MAWEVGYVGALLQIPDLDLGISRSSAKNETIRVELSTGESCKGGGRGSTNISTWNKRTHSDHLTQVTTVALTTASTFVSDFGEDSTSLDIREGPVLQNSEEKKWEKLVW